MNMDRTAHIMMAVLNDKLTDRLWICMTPMIIFMVFTPSDSAVNIISHYISYILAAGIAIRMTYVLVVSRKKDYPPFEPEKYKMNRSQMIKFYSVHIAVFAVLFIFTLIFRVPVALPASAVLLAITVVGFILSLRKYKKDKA